MTSPVIPAPAVPSPPTDLSRPPTSGLPVARIADPADELPPLTVAVDDRGDTAVLRARGEVDLLTVADLRAVVDAWLPSGVRTIVLDLRGRVVRRLRRGRDARRRAAARPARRRRAADRARAVRRPGGRPARPHRGPGPGREPVGRFPPGRGGTGQPMQIGYKLAAEAFDPQELVRQAVLAEAAGFDFVEISDHFHPWLDVQGHSPFAWTVLGAIAAKTDRIELATGVTCPTVRYHPAIIAQAAATLALVSDGRFALGVGSGERLNEHVVGRGLPAVARPPRDAPRGAGDHPPALAGRLPVLRGQAPAAGGRPGVRPARELPLIAVAASGPASATLAAELRRRAVRHRAEERDHRGLPAAGGSGPALRRGPGRVGARRADRASRPRWRRPAGRCPAGR